MVEDGIIEMSPPNLPRGSHTLPDAEEAEDPAGQKTQNQLPSHTAQLLDTSRHIKHAPPEKMWNFTLIPKLMVNTYGCIYTLKEHLTRMKETHCQNSVAAEVVFLTMVWFIVTFVTSWRPTQLSVSQNGQKNSFEFVFFYINGPM